MYYDKFTNIINYIDNISIIFMYYNKFMNIINYYVDNISIIFMDYIKFIYIINYISIVYLHFDKFKNIINRIDNKSNLMKMYQLYSCILKHSLKLLFILLIYYSIILKIHQLSSCTRQNS